jgi:hypothetical protein
LGGTFSRRRERRLDVVPIGIEYESGVVIGLRCTDGRRCWGRELARLESGEVGENRHHLLTEGLTQRLDGCFPASGADLDGYCERQVWGRSEPSSPHRESTGFDCLACRGGALCLAAFAHLSLTVLSARARPIFRAREDKSNVRRKRNAKPRLRG